MLERLADQLVARGERGLVLEVALAALAVDVLRECSHRTVIRIHVAEENLAEAAAAPRLLRRVVHDHRPHREGGWRNVGPAPEPRTSRRSVWEHPLLVGVVVAVVGGVMTLLGIVLGRERPGDGAATQGTGTASATSTDSPGAGCGAVSSDFTDPQQPAWAARNAAAPVPVADGVQVVAEDGADVRADLQGAVTAPWLAHEVRGDFSFRASLTVAADHSYQGAGLLLYRDAANYVRLERGYGRGAGVAFEFMAGGRYVKLHAPFPGEDPVPTTATSVELRLDRRGSAVTAWWRSAGAERWNALTGKAGLDGDTWAGLVVVNTSQPPEGDPLRAPLSATFHGASVQCL
ncbi:DUF1349 domain-containing protein [Kineococcus indalonis]|uniref:DUF1349 domain-containing protein n=1 Tax=Kineococcus indalonis TaxID=2696566 RepID=UPI0014129E33|nr:DUF1349 domain-containing protein [Kineococcus indalonis]NAZ84771.1 hypothetical protein [Kineococcus indalonis]